MLPTLQRAALGYAVSDIFASLVRCLCDFAVLVLQQVPGFTAKNPAGVMGGHIVTIGT